MFEGWLIIASCAAGVLAYGSLVFLVTKHAK